MQNNCAIDQTEIENLSYEFSDEALEIAAGGEKVAGNITLYYYYCTALYFCPAPFGANAGAGVPTTPLSVQFNPCLPANAANTAIVVSMPSLGTGNTNASVNA